MSTGSRNLDRVLEADGEFIGILANRDVPAELLADFLRMQGFPVSASTIRTFRRAHERKGNLDSH